MPTQADPATARRCQGTPTVTVVDARGLPVRTIRYNRTLDTDLPDECITRQTFTPPGWQATRLDARLGDAWQADPATPPNFRYACSLSGRVLQVCSQDAGDLHALYDIEGGIRLHQHGSRRLEQAFDLLHRRVTIRESTDGIDRISERLRYADRDAPAGSNLHGRVWQQYTPAGMIQMPAYGLTGQPLLSQQQFLLDAVVDSDWSGSDPATLGPALAEEIYTTRWSWNPLSQQRQSIDATGNRLQQDYDISGRPAASALRLPGASTAQAVLSAIDYTAAGQVRSETAGNGVVTEYSYEPQTRRLAALVCHRPARSGRRATLQALTYGYDPVGNLLSLSDASQPTRFSANRRISPDSQYEYDALYQLHQAVGRENATASQQTSALTSPIVPLCTDDSLLSGYTRTHDYDRGGNLTAIHHNGASAYTLAMIVAQTSNRAVRQTGDLTPADIDGLFDACGNLLQLQPGQPLAWNTRNQLQRCTQVSRDGASDNYENYWYDSQGRRAAKQTVTLTGGTIRRSRVLYLPGLQLRQTRQTVDGVDTLVESLQLVQLGNTGRQSVRLLHWDTGCPAGLANDQWRYSLDNQTGSSMIELDRQADIVTREEYYPYGGTAVWSVRSTVEADYKYLRYSGQERDASGLYDYGFRYYAPWLGRWLNPDPAGTVNGLNLYCMVGNNPVVNRDVNGLVFGKVLDRIKKGALPAVPVPGHTVNTTSLAFRDRRESVAGPGPGSNAAVAGNRFHRFLNLLQQEGAAPPAAADVQQQALASYASKHVNFEHFVPKMEEKYGLQLITNSGGGDCLLHALEGRNLGFEERIELRDQIAQSAATLLPGGRVSGDEIAMTLMQSLPGNDLTALALMEGRHQVSSDTLQAMIKTPGMYGGDIEIQAYTALPHTPDAVHVLTAEGSDRIEIRRHTPADRLTIFRGPRTEAMPFVSLLLEQPDIPVIHLAGSHWQRAI